MAQSLPAARPRTLPGPGWLAPLSFAAVVLQALVLIYVGILGAIFDLVLQRARLVLPTTQMSAAVERGARALAPHVLADERDWPILPVLASITVLVPASITLQFLNPGVPWWGLAMFHHAVLLGAGGQRFAKVFSIKHNEAHRPKGFFRGVGRRVLRRYTETLSMFYGNILGLDYIHHVKVHHAEDGGPDDPQNTKGYDRTSTWHFLHYLGVRHMAVSLGIATPRYLLQNGRTRDARVFLVSATVFYALVAALVWYNWRVAIAVAIGPVLLGNIYAGLASWLQHSFESPEGAADPIADTITIVSPTEFLNEGFHLAHHYRSGTHWTELPQRFDEWRARHPAVQPIVIDGVDWVELAVLLYVRRRVDLVAERWRVPSPAGDPVLTVEARTALLRQRLGGSV